MVIKRIILKKMWKKFMIHYHCPEKEHQKDGLKQMKNMKRWFETDEEHEKMKEIEEKNELLLYNKRHIV